MDRRQAAGGQLELMAGNDLVPLGTYQVDLGIEKFLLGVEDKLQSRCHHAARHALQHRRRAETPSTSENCRVWRAASTVKNDSMWQNDYQERIVAKPKRPAAFEWQSSRYEH